MPNVSHCGSEFDFIVVAKLCQAIHQLVLQALIQATDVGDVWGGGRKIGAQLREHPIHTALELQRMNPAAAKAEGARHAPATHAGPGRRHARKPNPPDASDGSNQPPLWTRQPGAGQRGRPVWGMKQEWLSSGFTSDWRGLLMVHSDG
jgi:hypothetical protein